jgi:hypothetical protein
LREQLNHLRQIGSETALLNDVWSGKQEMRGYDLLQTTMLSMVNPEKGEQANHPIRPIESLAEVALNELSPLFAQMHSEVTRPSVPRERLLKASLSIVLYRVRKLLVILNAMLHNKTRYHASVSTSSVSTLFFLVGADAQHGCC